MDYAASTPVDQAVLDIMKSAWQAAGNASSVQNLHGAQAKKKVEDAREKVAYSIGAKPEEIFFTSGATEANNIALLGISQYLKKSGKTHIVSSKTEHACVLGPLEKLKTQGFDMSYSELLPCGMADGPLVLKEITEKTGFVSLQAVNNETGVINPLFEVAEGISGKEILFHSDVTQALGKIPFNVKECGLHMASLSAHKVYGLQVVGALYIREDVQGYISPLLFGGGQEGQIRSGTLPVALIAGFGEACRLAVEEQAVEREKLECYNTLLRNLLDEAGIDYKINGHDYGADSRNWRVPGIMNIHFSGIENEWLLEAIDTVSFSTGSACSAQGDQLSHVLKAMGLDREGASQSVRISFGRFTTEDEIRSVAQSFIEAIKAICELKEAA